MNKAGPAGSGIDIQAWRQLITGYPDSGLTHDDLLMLWSIGQEITSADVVEILSGR